ncbi:hypothetical protein COV82_05925 [Candidatus Peregrinibacteria bacterium CG11_big_fil_rev_8_21_14_0_20_46_8]|nr:MAG: hypothetical protein COV82_05925 [Candidatus Peregrinibacteria bacterium CG11_big_fil_rev_8_21_14_0_20_46_8]
MKKIILVFIIGIALTACLKNTPTREVTVHFSSERDNENFQDCGKTEGVYREVPAELPGEFAAMLELFDGPTRSEQQGGLQPFWFDTETGPGALRDIKVDDGIAFVDWRDIRRAIPNASTSCGSQSFLVPVENSLTQLNNIERVIHTIDGSAATFYEWMQMECPKESGTCDANSERILELTYLQNAPPKNYPDYIYKNQYPTTLVVGNDDSMYAMIRQPNLNWNIEVPRNATPWAGILRSTDLGKTWHKFFTVKNPDDPAQPGQKMKFNPVGIFTADNAIFVDIADDRGAGSGEGNLVRFVTEDDGATWERAGCFYLIPENYFQLNIEFELNSDVLKTPHAISQSTSCIY